MYRLKFEACETIFTVSTGTTTEISTFFRESKGGDSDVLVERQADICLLNGVLGRSVWSERRVKHKWERIRISSVNAIEVKSLVTKGQQEFVSSYGLGPVRQDRTKAARHDRDTGNCIVGDRDGRSRA